MAMKEVSSLLSWLKKPASESKTVTGPNDLIPSIDLEKQIGEQIYNALQGSVVEEVLRKTKISRCRRSCCPSFTPSARK